MCGSVDDKSRAFEKCFWKTAINYVICLFLVSWRFFWHAFIGFRPLAQDIVCLTLSKESIFFFQCWIYVPTPGLKIATDTVANATNIFSLATKNYSLVAKVATRFLYDLDLN